MLLDAETWVYGKLSTDAALTLALAGGEGVVKSFPNDFNMLPSLPYSVSQSVSNMDNWDDQAVANDVIVTLDVYTANAALTRPIEVALDAVMVGLLFNMDFREAIGDESAKTQHVSMRYSRMAVMAEDLV